MTANELTRSHPHREGRDAARSPRPPSTRTRRRRDRGAGLVEYALLVALIAVACMSALQLFGSSNGGSINRSADSVADILGP